MKDHFKALAFLILLVTAWYVMYRVYEWAFDGWPEEIEVE